MKNGPVYQFAIEEIPALAEFWGIVKTLSFIPDEFDLESYQQHISQPNLVKVSEAIEHHPTAECIANELALTAENEKNPKSSERPLSLLQNKNGVVKLGPGMDRPTRIKMTNLLSNYFSAQVLESGNYLYPPGGFKEWHTNMVSVPGWRMYIVNKTPEGRSFFRYVDPESLKLETVWDQPGDVNIFELRSDLPFWHAVKSIDTYRWSKGFVIPDDWRRTLGI